MNKSLRSRSLREVDPFALDPSSEQFFAVAAPPPCEVPPADDGWSDEPDERSVEARLASPAVVQRRRRLQRVVHRVVLALAGVALLGFAEGRVESAPAVLLHAASPASLASRLDELVPVVPLQVDALAGLSVDETPAPPASGDPDSPPRAAARDDDELSRSLDVDLRKLDVTIDTPSL